MALMRTNPLFAELSGVSNRLNRLFGRDDFWEDEGRAGAVSVAFHRHSSLVAQAGRESVRKPPSQ